MSTFEFELGDEVELIESGEVGVVIGRAEYVNDTPDYVVRYKADSGCQRVVWWSAGDMRKT